MINSADNVKNLNEGDNVKNVKKRNSDVFDAESEPLDEEADADGYGYDDDEYYHFNIKRNDEASTADSQKSVQSSSNKKEGIHAPIFGLGKSSSGKDRDGEKVEMISFNETHPMPISDENLGKNDFSKPLGQDENHKKTPSEPLDGIKMSDLKGDSAIDEKTKDRKEEGTVGNKSAPPNDSKLSDPKKTAKANDDKDSVKLKDTKFGEDAEKKDKDTSVKEGKDSVATKNVKETAKNFDEKNELKTPKVNENSKLGENVEKINGKPKEVYNAKIATPEKSATKVVGEENSSVNCPNEDSQVNNQDNFASNNCKENEGTFKTSGIEENELKNWEEPNEKNAGLKDYQDEIIERGQYMRNDNGNMNYEDQNNEDCVAELSQEPGANMNGYVAIPTALEVQDEGLSNYYKKQNTWKNEDKNQQPQRFSSIQRPLNQRYHFNFPPSELENTDYHKNYIKSLKQYKAFENAPKVLNSDLPGENSVNPSREKGKSRKKKRSKVKRRKSISTDDFGRRQFNSKIFNPERDVYNNLDVMEQPELWPQSDAFYDSISNAESNLRGDMKYESPKQNNRNRRKSQSKIEYEIKIINQNKPDQGGVPLLRGTQRRKKKEVKGSEKYFCSQVPGDDSAKFKETGENFFERIFKRKAPLWKRNQLNKQNEASAAKNKGAPSGYYSNRVKFGQKHIPIKNEDQFTAGEDSIKDRTMSFSSKKPLTESDNNYLQRSWRDPMQGVKHDPTKRYDENSVLNKKHDNSLLLVKKDRNGEKVAKTFVNLNNHDKESDLNSEQLAKILSKDNDYIVLKKTDNNRFQKIGNNDFLNEQPSSTYSQPLKKYDIFGLNKQDNIEDNTSRNRGVLLRSYRSNDQKLHGLTSKSNLKKTFEKFKDLADFFKDNEQGSREGHQLLHDSKEKSSIVFSEDKLPDPIVLSSNNDDFKEKSGGSKQKPASPLSSISNNFKKLDQGKKMEEMKSDESNKDLLISEKSDWAPALKNAFPEAKSINLLQKNGNEIIVLDFDRNQIKTDQGNRVVFSKTPYDEGNGQASFPFVASASSTSSISVPNNRQVEIVLNEGSLPTFLESKLSRFGERKLEKQTKLSSSDQEANYSVLNNPSDQAVITLPLNQYSQLPYLFKQNAGRTNKIENNYKTILKKDANLPLADIKMSDNFNQFLRDYKELSEINTDPLKKKPKLNKKRSSTETLAISDASARQLRDLLQTINGDSNVGAMDKDVSSEAAKNANLDQLQKWLPNADDYDGGSTATLQKSWDSSVDEDNKSKTAENDYQSSLWQELAATSSKIQRLRREGATESKLRQIIEEVLPLRGKRWSENGFDTSTVTERLLGEDNLKDEKSEKNSLMSFDSEVEKSDAKKESPYQSQLEPEFKNEINLLSENFESENNSADFSRNVNINRDETDELSSSENLIDRRTNGRVKRSPDGGDSEKKVSKSEVKNKILKSSEEDNYQSVYSSGIKRKLLSIDDEMEIPDGLYFADKPPSRCARNALNKCINPDILNIFRGDESESTQNRARRSLFDRSHSNYKREIDLDESMPNDFQNFLVTSLGLNSQVTGFGGSKKREVDKKDEALWESKESFDNDHKEVDENPIGKKSVDKDSALEKREVSNKEAPKRKNFKENLNYLEKRSEVKKLQPDSMETVNHSEMKAKLQDKSTVKSKPSQYEETKVPTQIRIQITKASTKEKKSSKPAVEENEVGSNDIETIPSRNFEKGKSSPVRVNSPQKSQQNPNYKYPESDSETEESSDDENGQQYYVLTQPLRRGSKRKKKKYVQENPMKPINDFLSFDQKSMEILMRKYFEDQNMQRNSNQKMPASNHLPQVETVYNPTQGTNKAQVHDFKPLFKLNSLSNKNSATAKNSLQSNDASAFDEEFMRSYLKEKSAQSKNNNKETSKEFEDVDWKPYSSLIRIKSDFNEMPSTASRIYKSYGIEMNPSTGKTEYNIRKPPSNQLKWYQTPYNYNPSEFSFSTSNPAPRENANTPNWNAFSKDNTVSNWIKYLNYLDSLPCNKETKGGADKTGGRTDDSWAEVEEEYPKKQKIGDKYKPRNLFRIEPKAELDEDSKIHNFPYKYMQLFEKDKPAVFESHRYDFSKDTDYSDPLEEEYIDLDELKKTPQYEVIGLDKDKKLSKIYDTSRYQGSSKNLDFGEGLSEDEEEIDEDYDENEEGSNDLAYLAPSSLVHSETAKNSVDDNNVKGSDYLDDSLYSTSNAYVPKSKDLEYANFDTNFDRLGYTNTEKLEALEPNSQQIILSDAKNDPNARESSDVVLMKVNEDANILGKNLAKNLMKCNYDTANDDTANADQFLENRITSRKYHDSELWAREKPKITHNEWKIKLKRSQRYSPKEKRFFYPSIAETYDSDRGSFETHVPYRRNRKNVLMKRNPLNAELKDGESESEYESEQSNKHFISNLANCENGENESDNFSKESNTNKRNSNLEWSKNSRESKVSNISNIDDVNDNLKDDSETIAEDNILENVIGKYIMRKSVKVKPERNLEKHFSDTEENVSDFEGKTNPEETREHKRRKKSLENEVRSEKFSRPKTWRKRLSSGHLTEKNYKKFHKKNFINKRNVKTLSGADGAVESFAPDDLSLAENESIKPESDLQKVQKDTDLNYANQIDFKQNSKEKKRSLNLFKKMGGKEKDTKKEDLNVKTVGFEPIFSSPDSKSEILTNDNEELLAQNETPLRKIDAPKSSADDSGFSKTSESKFQSQDRQISNVEGPWKIELDEKYNEKIDRNQKDRQNSLGATNSEKVNLKDGFNSNDENQNLKAYLVIRKNVRSVEQSQNPAGEALSPTSGASKREVGNSYLPKAEKGPGNSKMHLWKSEECAPSNVHLISLPEIPFTKPETNRALRDRKSPFGADLKNEPPYLMQRHTEKNTSLGKPKF